MFTVGPIHTRDHGSGCSIADAPSPLRGSGRSKVLLYANSGRRNQGANAPRGTPGGLEVEPKFELHNIPNTTVSIFTARSQLVFPLPDIGWPFYILLLCNYHITGIA